MRGLAIAIACCAAVAPSTASAQDRSTLGTVRLTHAVLAGGQPLAPGAYEVRTTNESLVPAVGESPASERWVEFVQNGSVAGREVATVVADDDIAAIAKGPVPAPGVPRVDLLKGGEYLRVWINRAGTNYIINMPLIR